MSLTDLTTIKPSKNQIFLTAIALAFFLFFFTQAKETDTSQMEEEVF